METKFTKPNKDTNKVSETNLKAYRPNDSTSFLDTVFSRFTSHFSRKPNPSQPSIRKGRSKCAFTLAEILITLGIIGVVAAMTLPPLIQNHQKRSLEVATQKFYSTMSQAVKKYMADEGVDDLRNTPIAGAAGEANEVLEKVFLNKYLKIVKKCENNSECFASQYRGWNGTEETGIPKDYDFGYGDTYVLSDGSVIRINSNYLIDIWVDVNGKKGPNRVGYDLWNMSLYYDGTIDESHASPEAKHGETGWDTPHDAWESRFELCKTDTYGGCFGHFLENNFKFDY